MDVLTSSAYTSLPPYTSSTSSQYAGVFRSIVVAPPSAIHPTQRVEVLEVMLRDLGDEGRSGGWGDDVKLLALQAVKTLGRNPIGSEGIAKPESLRTLLSLASLPFPRLSSPPLSFSSPSTSSPSPIAPLLAAKPASPPSRRSSLLRRSVSPVTPHPFGSPSSVEALRILANGLLLHEGARDGLWEAGGAERFVAALGITESKSGRGKEDGNPNPPTPETTFILARILFLMTVSPSPSADLPSLVAPHSPLLPALVFRLSHTASPTSGPDPNVELLKLTFNIVLHIPHMSEEGIEMGDAGRYLSGLSGEGSDLAGRSKEKAGLGEWWDERLDVLLPPLLTLLTTHPLPSISPPTFSSPSSSTLPLPPTLAHTLNALLAFPTHPLSSTWLSSSPSTSPPRSSSPTYISDSDNPSSKPKSRPNIFRRVSPSSSRSSPTSLASAPSVPERLLELAERVTKPWEVPEVDPLDAEGSGREDPYEKQRGEKRRLAVPADEIVEESLPVLFLVVRRLATGIPEFRELVKKEILPDDLDRSPNSLPLEQRPNLLGRMIRLLVSTRYPHTKGAIGELFWTLADSNASNLSALIGYGNAAGFLFTKGISSPNDSGSSASVSTSAAPPSSSSPSKPSPPAPSINPITGRSSASDPTHDTTMTPEEAECEAERLFVLFDRMEKNPAVSLGLPSSSQTPDGGVVHPVRGAVESGKYAEIEERERVEELKRLEEEERRDEEEAIRQVQEVRRRRAGRGGEEAK